MNITCPTPICWASTDVGWLEADGSFTCSHCGEEYTPEEFQNALKEAVIFHEQEIDRLTSLQQHLAK